MNALEVLNAVREERYFDRRDYVGAKAFIRAHPEAFTHLPDPMSLIDGAFAIADQIKTKGGGIFNAATEGAVGAAYKTLNESYKTIRKSIESVIETIDTGVASIEEDVQRLVREWPEVKEIVQGLSEPIKRQRPTYSAKVNSVEPERQCAELYILAGLMERGQVEVARKIGVLK